MAMQKKTTGKPCIDGVIRNIEYSLVFDTEAERDETAKMIEAMRHFGAGYPWSVSRRSPDHKYQAIGHGCSAIADTPSEAVLLYIENLARRQ